MDIKELFLCAEKIIAEETKINNSQDLLSQYEIIRSKSWPKQTKESQILNNFSIAASSYSVVRKYFKVLYAEDISNFDHHFSTNHFKQKTEPNLSYEDWVEVTLSWGNCILKEHRIPNKNNLEDLIHIFKISSICSRTPRQRLVYSLATGLPKVKNSILSNSELFWKNCNNLSMQHPGKAFNYAKNFSDGITQMGPPLICNFFKELGLLYYVKTDVHLSNFLGQMISTNKKLSEKKQFILSWLLAKEIGIEPFYLDKILYVGGKYSNPSITNLFSQHKSKYIETVQRLVHKIPDYS